MINALFYLNHYTLVSRILISYELGYIMGLEIKKKISTFYSTFIFTLG